ncbi:sigma-70 family RNA polymerase sigma factor [Kribbella sp.]|uniref:RNA polymerase sigma factor n=1 Tax=Kribbella sp. TaxID=1871183 RepID=UPI002D40495E|nr:sigma-70 family RNA polymerase sigma factor [Kribbella sp.]HZX04172.1 sigma-70 family RNA polymerase sigma factor [Kribbella sp.]
MSGVQLVQHGPPLDAGPPGSDRILWERAAEGDGEAFGQLYDRHARAVYAFLYRRTGSWSDAEDLTSSVFLHAWRRRTDVVLDRDSALPWLLRAADYTVRNEWRAKLRYRRAVAAAHVLVADVRDHADDVAGRLDDDRRIQEARRLLKRLPKQEREIVELCIWAGLDQQAAAVALDVPLGTVKSRLSRARKHLRELNLLTSLEPPA